MKEANFKPDISGWLKKRLTPGICITLLFLGITNLLKSQQQYATTIISESYVTSSGHSVDANPATYSELEASSGVIIGIGGYSSDIEMEFPTLVPANQTTFVRIETDDDILSSLLGGTLGDLLSTVAGVALIGNQEFSVEAKNGATVVLSGNSTNPISFSGEQLKVVLDANNHTYLAITPGQPYQSIRISNHVGSLIGLGVKKHMKVWDPYYVVQGASCIQPQFTSYDAAGISLEVLNLGGGVNDLERAIDGNLMSHSTLSLGVVGVASNITQRVYFEGVSQPTDMFAVRLGIDPAVLAITLGQGIEISTRNGVNLVTTDQLTDLATPADIAAMQSGQPATLYISPNAPIDRVVVRLNGVLNVAVAQTLDVFEVYKISQAPILNVNSSDTIICTGTVANLVSDAVNPSDEIRWYDDSTATTPIAITGSGVPFTTGLLYSDTTFYVASGVPGCPSESLRIPVEVKVMQGPDPSNISVPVDPQYCAADVVDLGASSTSGVNFQWYLTPDGTTPIFSGQQTGNHTFTIPHSDSISISGLTTADSPFTLYVAVQDTVTGCWSSPGEYASVTITIIDEPAPTTTQATQSFCAEEMATIMDLQVNESPLNWYDAPVGGNLLTSGTLLQNGTNYYASWLGGVCESSQRLEIEVVIQDEPAPVTTDPQQHFCALDNATIADLIVTGTSINWYDVNGNALLPSTSLSDGETYFATEQGAACESSDTLMITVSVSDLPAPTTDAAQQEFCIADNPTIEDILVNETTLVWYDGGGNPIAPGTPLTDNTSYYAALVSPNCESTDQLEILVTFEQVAAPTADEENQVFCAPGNGSAAATVGDISVNEADIVWYDAPTGGSVVDPSTPLTHGDIYYAAQVGNSCESTSRLEVTIAIEDLPAPTTSETTQSFCTASNPVAVDIEVNETNVNWYDVEGNHMTETSELQDGATYYGVTSSAHCQSNDSLAVTIIIEDMYGAEMTGQLSGICITDTIEYSAPAGMDNYDWSVVGGTIVAGGTSSDHSVWVVWENAPVTTIEVGYGTGNGCTMRMEEVAVASSVICSDLEVEKTVSNLNPFIGDEIVFTITVTNTGQDEFSEIEVDEVIQSGFTYVEDEATHGSYDVVSGIWTIENLEAGGTAVLLITVTVNATGDYSNVASIVPNGTIDDTDPDNNSSEVIVEPSCLTVYNEISPNGDGVNDVLYVDCIEQFPSNSIIIFNRYGNKVYSVEGYENDWGGVANVGGVVGKGEPLPAGTYYYLLKVEDEEFETSGWIYILR